MSADEPTGAGDAARPGDAIRVDDAMAPGEPTLVIGLTGPIGCGKSTVAAWLGELGATVVDADLVAREVVEPGEPALAEVLETFGPDVASPDGSLDRAALGRIVFTDPEALAPPRGDHPSGRPAADPRSHRGCRRGTAPRPWSSRRSSSSRAVSPSCATRSGSSSATRPPSGTASPMRGADAADTEARIAAQSDIVERLMPAATRVIDTSGSADGHATRRSRRSAQRR